MDHTTPAEDLCTVNDSFAGIPLGDCGEPATATVRFACPLGHEETTPTCEWHRGQLTDPLAPAWCPTCAEQGRRGVPVRVAETAVA